MNICVSPSISSLVLGELTRHGSCSSAGSVVVYDDGIAFHHSSQAKIAAVARIGDFAVLEDFDGDFHGIYSRPAIVHDGHPGFARTVSRSAIGHSSSGNRSAPMRLTLGRP